MILAGDVGLLVARESLFVSKEDGCNVCVFMLCCFLAEFVRSLAKFVRNKRWNDEEVRWRELKCVFVNRFLFAAWNFGFAFGAARLVESYAY